MTLLFSSRLYLGDKISRRRPVFEGDATRRWWGGPPPPVHFSLKCKGAPITASHLVVLYRLELSRDHHLTRRIWLQFSVGKAPSLVFRLLQPFEHRVDGLSKSGPSHATTCADSSRVNHHTSYSIYCYAAAAAYMLPKRRVYAKLLLDNATNLFTPNSFFVLLNAPFPRFV